MNCLIYYLVISYLVGLIVFFIEFKRLLKNQDYKLIQFGFLILLISPLTAWHGVLHYLALAWCKVRNKRFEPWV